MKQLEDDRRSPATVKSVVDAVVRRSIPTVQSVVNVVCPGSVGSRWFISLAASFTLQNRDWTSAGDHVLSVEAILDTYSE